MITERVRENGTYQRFPCSCGGEFKCVIDTRVQPDGTVRRRRECLACGQRVSTVETVVQEAREK